MIIYDQHYDLHVGPEAVDAQCLCHDMATPPVALLPPVEENKMVRLRAEQGEEFEPITGRVLVLCSVSSARYVPSTRAALVSLSYFLCGEIVVLKQRRLFTVVAF